MDFGLRQRVALVTGGSRGIGRAVAVALAEQGVSVALCGRTAETLNEAAAEIRAHGVEAWPIEADVSRLADVERFVAEAAAAAGRVDILVNNAVTSMMAPFDEQTDEHWRHHIDVKLMAYIRGTRAVMPHMKAGGWGRIVNIGGMTARIASPLRITNGVVNAGIANFTKQLAAQAAADNITINCLHPGSTATDRLLANFARRARDAAISAEEMAARSAAEIPIGRLIQPRDIASAVLFLCSAMAEAITGQSIAVDGGASASVIY